MLDFATLFRPLAERGQLLYFVYHPESGRVVYASASCQSVLGVEPEALTEALPSIVARVHPDDISYAQARLGHLQQGRFVEDVELRLEKPNDPEGGVQWLCITAARVEHESGTTYISGTVADVTRNREYLENADRFNTKKNTTLEILSHDLAGPFIMIKQVAGFVSEKVEELNDSTINELLMVMQTTCQDSINMIRDFVDTEFLESVNVQMKPERTNLAEELRQLIEQFQSSEENLSKHFAYEGPEQLYYSLDKNKFMQVINNLLSNSIKFTPDGGQITIYLQEDAQEVQIRVVDTGVGIPAALQPVLFERFTPARRPGLRGEKTTGLGMSIIKAIVELHGGRIWVESAEEQGSTFFIALPREQPE
ncbi:sensor histidine kinase [Hymenobacter fodinae]|uniref:histidine kinase n=1 Tax=Hymenobacter fodinae TaxID=2510796 RepID=A0A4Z0P2H2_9BACT|nr:PAS domain-containing sensor histidine kinase [Hymenobacter fodinae]TGE05441.1 PAS domain-containing sensor histidine kinase [Hymenobacter fodinae]